MKAIMMSIRPQHVANILNGLKTIEVRKRFPSDYVGWVYIYCTKDTSKGFLYKVRGYGYRLEDEIDIFLPPKNGKVVARFWCDKVETIFAEPDRFDEYYFYNTGSLDMDELLKQSCLEYNELDDYLYANNGYAIHITKLEIFDKPKEISEFYAYGDKKLKLNYHQEARWLTQLTRAPQSYCFIEV